MIGRFPVLIPVGLLGSAKSRLAEVLTRREREELMVDLLVGVLDAVKGVDLLCAIVVTPDGRVADLAGCRGHQAILSRGHGLNEDLGAALAQFDRGGDGGAVLMADLPDLHGDALKMALTDIPRVGGLVASDQRGEGTSLLAWRGLDAPPALAFGPGSFAAHRRQFALRGEVTAMERNPAFRDLDCAADLQRTRLSAKTTMMMEVVR